MNSPLDAEIPPKKSAVQGRLSKIKFVGGAYRVTKWIYVSTGETKHQFQWSLVHAPIMIIASVIGVRWGAFGVAVGYAVGMCLLSYPAMIHCVQKLPLTLANFLSSIWRPAIASILSAISLYLVQFIIPPINVLLLSLVLKGLIYLLLWVFLVDFARRLYRS